MNNGFFSFPSVADNRLLEVKQFDSSGVYVIPPNAKRIEIFSVGGGGGGGGGRRGDTSANASGGGGGGGGNIILEEYFLTDLITGARQNAVARPNIILSIIIGAGGNGGAGAAAIRTNGSNGSTGGITSVGPVGYMTNVSSPVLWSTALGGVSGTGGSLSIGSGGNVGTCYFYGVQILSGLGSNGSVSSGSSTTVYYIAPTNAFYHGGAGGGGYNATGPVTSAGGDVSINDGSLITAATIGPINYERGTIVRAGGAINSSTKPADLYENIFGIFSPGYGGPGGGGGVSTSASPGGNGYRGSGGGGGGGSESTITAGAGGNGGNGYVAIAVYE